MATKYYLTPAEVYQRANELESRIRQSPYLDRMARIDLVKEKILNSNLSARKKRQLYNRLALREDRIKQAYVHEGGPAIPVKKFKKPIPAQQNASSTGIPIAQITPAGKIRPIKQEKESPIPEMAILKKEEYKSPFVKLSPSEREERIKKGKKLVEKKLGRTTPVTTRSKTAEARKDLSSIMRSWRNYEDM